MGAGGGGVGAADRKRHSWGEVVINASVRQRMPCRIYSIIKWGLLLHISNLTSNIRKVNQMGFSL